MDGPDGLIRPPPQSIVRNLGRRGASEASTFPRSTLVFARGEDDGTTIDITSRFHFPLSPMLGIDRDGPR